MVNWLYLSANTTEYKRSAALMAPRLLTWLALLCFSETQACSIYLSSFNINIKKTLGDTCVSSLSSVWKEGQIRFPEKRGFGGKYLGCSNRDCRRQKGWISSHLALNSLHSYLDWLAENLGRRSDIKGWNRERGKNGKVGRFAQF